MAAPASFSSKWHTQTVDDYQHKVVDDKDRPVCTCFHLSTARKIAAEHNRHLVLKEQ